MRCSAGCGATATQVVSDDGPVLLVLCPSCQHLWGRLSRGRSDTSSRPLPRRQRGQLRPGA